MIHTQWYCSHEHIFRHVDIYIPEAITDGPSSNCPYPVVYLLHGIKGYEGSWIDEGNVIDTLNALVSAGYCEPMILVMPDCNKWPTEERPIAHTNIWKNIFHYPQLSREHEIELSISELIDMIDSTYCVSSCTIAGLSDGARIAANVANIRPDRIRKIGLFSPVVHKEQFPTDTTQSYSIYVGSNDFFYANGNRFHHRLRKHDYPHQWVVLKGNHNWRMWRQCLSHLLRQ